MKKGWILLTGILLAASASRSQAQTPETPGSYPPPQPPLVVPVPERAQWTITLSYEGDDQSQTATNPVAKPKHRLHQIVSTKTGNLKRDTEIYDDGPGATYWFIGHLILMPEINSQPIRIIDFEQANAEHGEAGNPIESPHFPGMAWLQLKYYDAVATMQNQPCYHYVLKSGDATEIEAWISVKTGLPVSYRTGGTTYDYAFGAAPDADLELPDKYAQAMKSYQQIENRRKQLQKDLGG